MSNKRGITDDVVTAKRGPQLYNTCMLYSRIAMVSSAHLYNVHLFMAQDK